MAENQIDYEALVERALRGVLRQALHHAESKGLPGDHHFYITFRTDYPGAVVPPRLKASYPQEMTIVLQHQFWGLEIGDASFSVTLSFANQLERLTVPFAAVTGFADPAVKFGLQFESAKAATVPSLVEADAGKAPGTDAPGRNTDLPGPPEDEAAKVVTLDAFRKK